MRRKAAMPRWLVVAAALLGAGLIGIGVWRLRPAPAQYPALTTPIFARVDQDADGWLSPEEYAAVSFPDEPFAGVDADGDGALSPAELEQQIVRTDATALAKTRRDRAIQAAGSTPDQAAPPSQAPPSQAPQAAPR